jgi:hypothetical protein
LVVHCSSIINYDIPCELLQWLQLAEGEVDAEDEVASFVEGGILSAADAEFVLRAGCCWWDAPVDAPAAAGGRPRICDMNLVGLIGNKGNIRWWWVWLVVSSWSTNMNASIERTVVSWWRECW